MSNVKELIEKHDGSRFQKELGALIEMNKLHNVVEIGHGVSTLFILDALDQLGEGRLISIDKAPWFSDVIEHPRLTLVKKKSYDALLDAYYNIGPFDCAAIDGEHEIGAVTFDMNVCWEFLKPEGFMIMDDWSWSNHGAYDRFISERNLVAIPMGSTMVVQKPKGYGYCPSSLARQTVDLHQQIALKAEEEWLANGGVKHDAFKD